MFVLGIKKPQINVCNQSRFSYKTPSAKRVVQFPKPHDPLIQLKLKERIYTKQGVKYHAERTFKALPIVCVG